MNINEIIDEINLHIKTVKPKVIEYGEVYTDLNIVNEMLSVLPDDFWKNPYLKILDPCNGVGNFPSIIIKKLMENLSDFEKNENLRYKWIIENIIYASEIQPKNLNIYEKLFDPKGIYNMNIFNGSYFDLDIKNHFNVNNFDLIVGNPPYQIGENSRKSVSLYHKFVKKSQKISKYVLMITPCRWYSNPSMLDFRMNMINNYGLKILQDKGNIFDEVDIKGGVSYFLLEKDYNGECIYNGEKITFSNNIITKYNSLIDKVKEYDSFSRLLNSDQYFKIRNKDDRFLLAPEKDTVKCYVSKQNGNIKYIKKDLLKITNNHNKYKVFLPTASGTKSDIEKLGRTIIGLPKEVASRSFVHFAFDSYDECESFISYINTDIIKQLIGIKKQTQLVKKDVFSLVPIVPLDKIWDNESVKKYLKIK